MRVRHPRTPSSVPEAPADYEQCLKIAEDIFEQADGGMTLPDQRQSFSAEAAELRWFLLPSEAQDILRGNPFTPANSPPFTPHLYEVATQQDPRALHHYSTIPPRAERQNPSVVCSVIPEEEAESDSDLEQDSADQIPEAEENDFTVALEFCMIDDEEEDKEMKTMRTTSPAPISLWKSPTRSIMKPTLEALTRHQMISDGDRVLVCVSGGKDSLTLLHTLRQYQQQNRRFGPSFEMGAMTVVRLAIVVLIILNFQNYDLHVSLGSWK